MSIAVKSTVADAGKIKLTLDGLEKKHFRKAARKAVDQATKIVLVAAKTLVPTRTKSLKKSIGKKVKANRTQTGYYGLVGPRRDSKSKIENSERDFAAGKRKAVLKYRFKKSVKFQGRDILVNPVKYAHLVEFGRRSVRVKTKRVLADGSVVYGQTTRAVPPRPFMRPAWDANRETAMLAIRQAISAAVAEAKKGAK